jgi:hypothetical protein
MFESGRNRGRDVWAIPGFTVLATALKLNLTFCTYHLFSNALIYIASLAEEF